MRDARLRGEAGEFDGAARRRKIDDRVGVDEERQRIRGDLNPGWGTAGERTRIMVEPGRVVAFERAGEREARRLVDRPHDHAAHPASGAGDDDAQIGHALVSPSPGLRPVVALDDDEVDERGGVAELGGALVFFRTRDKRAPSRSRGIR